MAFLFGRVLLLELEVEPGPRNGREQATSGIIRASERNVSCCAPLNAVPFQRGCDRVSLTMKPAPSKQLVALLALMLAAPAQRLFADCSVTNLGVTPLNGRGFTAYSNSGGGLYPN